MPAGGGVLHETGDDVVGIIGITDGIRAAEEHLETDVRNARAQLAQALPRIFVQETHRGVEGRAAPHFQARTDSGVRRATASATASMS